MKWHASPYKSTVIYNDQDQVVVIVDEYRKTAEEIDKTIRRVTTAPEALDILKDLVALNQLVIHALENNLESNRSLRESLLSTLRSSIVNAEVIIERAEPLSAISLGDKR